MKKLIFLYFLFTLCVVEGQQRSQSFSVKSAQEIYLGAVLESSRFNDSEHSMLPVIDDIMRMGFIGLRIPSAVVHSDRVSMDTFIERQLRLSGSSELSNIPSFSYSIKTIPNYQYLPISFGQNVDISKWFGIPKPENTNTKLILDFSRTSFSMAIDIAPNGRYHLLDHELAKYDLNDLIYVNNISFGRRLMVIVESPLDAPTLTAIIKKMVEQSEVTKYDFILAAQCDFTIVNFDKEVLDFNASNPLQHAMDYLSRPFTSDDYGVPIRFSAAYVYDNRVFENQY